MRYSKNYEEVKTKNRGSTPHLFSSTSVFPGKFQKIKTEVRRTCSQVRRTFWTRSSQKTFILFIMTKPIHLLISECLLMLLECKISFSFDCTNILMVHLMLCCQMLEMDPNSSIGRMCLDKGNSLAENDQVESEGNWDGEGTWDTADSGKRKEVKAYTFFRMEKEDGTWDRYMTPCYVEGVNAFDGVTDLDCDKNYVSQEVVIEKKWKYTKLANGDKKLDKKLLVNLEGEIYVVEFYVNPEEDDVEPTVILGRDFLRQAKAIVNLQLGLITLWPEPPVYDSEDEELDALLANFSVEELPPLSPNPNDFPNYVCNMGKSSRNKNKQQKTYKMTYDDEGPSLSVNRAKTQEELTREEFEKDVLERVILVNEKRPVIETLKNSDKHKMMLDSVLIDRLKLDGEVTNEEEHELAKEVVKEHKVVKEGGDPGCFILPIRLEGKLTYNALVVRLT